MKKFFCIVIIIALSGCGIFEGTKKVGKDLSEDINFTNPLSEASRKEALSRARSDVNKARAEYNKCLERNNDNEAACTGEKEMYEKNTERYMELQKTD